jgi:hypothetical protein
MLFSKRKSEAEKVERELAGELLWSPVFSKETRIKIAFAIEDSIPVEYFRYIAVETAQALMCREYGVANLSGRNIATDDLYGFIATSTNEQMPDIIEALCIGFLKSRENDNGYIFVQPQLFHDKVNEILRLERVSFELVGGEMIAFESREMFESVVFPVITLLAGKVGWERVETAYRSALDEIRENAGDAITDVTTALQQALELLGCEGNALGDLAKSGVKRNILTPYDANLIHWSNADRASKGDAHQSPDVTRSDAWLVVHVVGALILRLASGEPR